MKNVGSSVLVTLLLATGLLLVVVGPAQALPSAQTPSPSSSARITTVGGTVVDASGAAVPHAHVRLETAGRLLDEIDTDTEGRFAFTVAERGAARVVVTALGFAPATAAVTGSGAVVGIVLRPAAFFEAVNVTSSRADAPTTNPTATVTVLSSADLLTSAAVTLDDALKMVPGFSLFRRTSSRTSNPTAQGVALRGTGGSAQSRSLVLVDGVPLNDAFGGWVYWNKVPQVALDRVEVQRGSGSDLYGADAVGGVVQLLTLRPSRPTGRALVEGGNLGTARASLFGGGRTRGWRYSAGGEWFTLDGYIPVATEQAAGITPRGPIDSTLGSTHRSAMATSGLQTARGWRVDVSANVYDEQRENGTPASINSTASRQGSAEVAGAVAGGLLSVRGFGGTQQYHQTFSTVNATRTAEALNRDQRIPSTSGGAGGQWFRAWGRHALLIGAEGRIIEGASVETPYAQGRPLVTVEAGGTQKLGSAFVQDTLQMNDRLTVVVGAHGDSWRSTSKASGFTKSSGAFNPRVSGAYRLLDQHLVVRGSVYRGFRAPTLNEFYRSFSAGNTQTRPNEQLGPERLTGTDLGVQLARGRASARITGFWNVLDEAITTITLSSTPTLIVRQRANADTLRARGLELEGDVRLLPSLSVTLAGAVVRSRFTGQTDLRDKRVPQVPGYNAGVGLRYASGPWSASGQLRVTGPQFEDDLNVFTLRRATVVDVFASRALGRTLGRTLGRGTSVFVGIENLFDATYDVGRTPILTIGLPRAVRAGVLVTLP